MASIQHRCQISYVTSSSSNVFSTLSEGREKCSPTDRPTRLSIILGFFFFYFSSDIPLFLHLSFPIHFVWGERCRRSLPAKGAGATRYISKSITSPSLNKIEDRMGFQSVLVYWSHNWDSWRYLKTEYKFEIRFDPQGSFNTLNNAFLFHTIIHDVPPFCQ